MKTYEEICEDLSNFLTKLNINFNDEKTRQKITLELDFYFIKLNPFYFEVICNKTNNPNELIDNNFLIADVVLQLTKDDTKKVNRITIHNNQTFDDKFCNI